MGTSIATGWGLDFNAIDDPSQLRTKIDDQFTALDTWLEGQIDTAGGEDAEGARTFLSQRTALSNRHEEDLVRVGIFEAMLAADTPTEQEQFFHREGSNPSVIDHVVAGRNSRAWGSLDTLAATPGSSVGGPFGSQSVPGALNEVAAGLHAGANVTRGIRDNVQQIGGLIDDARAMRYPGYYHGYGGFGAQGAGYGGFGGGGGDFNLASAIGGFGAMESFYGARSDNEKAKKLLKMLLMMIMAGNYEAIQLALIVMGQISQDQVTKVAATVIKAKMANEQQMEDLNDQFKEMANLPPDQQQGSGRMNQLGLQMQKLIGEGQSFDHLLRNAMSWHEEVQNTVKSYLDATIPQRLGRSRWQ